MPLVDMADYVDGFTELKALCGYGFHKPHHPAVNGMFGLADDPPSFANTIQKVADEIAAFAKDLPPKSKYPERIGNYILSQGYEGFYYLNPYTQSKMSVEKMMEFTKAQKGNPSGVSGLGALACGGDCLCAKCKGVSGLGDVDFSGIGAYDAAWCEANQNGPWLQSVIDSHGCSEKPSVSAAVVANIQNKNFLRDELARTSSQQGGSTAVQPKNTADTWVEALQKLFGAAAPLFQKQPRQKIIVEKQPDYTTYAVIGGAVIVASVLAIAVGKSGRSR